MSLAEPLIEFSHRIGRYEYPVEQSAAFAEASRNYSANLAALEAVWPRTLLSIPETLPELEWLYARDGTLSGRYVEKRWIGGVSVPGKAAARMLGKVAVTGSSAVLLAPTHALQVRTVLDRMTRQQVLLVVIPAEQTAGTLLGCADFSVDLRAQRLWLACGPEWAEELTRILEAQDGIAPASMMIRVPGLNAATVERVLKPCEAILAQHSQMHRSQLAQIHARPRSPSRPPRRICTVAGPFELWNDAAFLLAKAPASCSSVTLESAMPTHSSALKFARAAEGCDAVVTANLGRADLPSVVPENVPWITWATTNRVARHHPSASLDRLIIADPAQREMAMNAGWPESSIFLGREPTRAPGTDSAGMPAIIADLPRPLMPRSVEEMSSQRLVWDRVEHEVAENPFCIGSSPVDYLLSVAEQIGMARVALPVELFVTELLIPCFARSLAHLLSRREVKFQVFGRGWDVVPDLGSRWRGPVETEADLENALGSTRLLIDVWPGLPVHAARRCGRPTIQPWGLGPVALSRALDRACAWEGPTIPVLDLQRVLDSLGSTAVKPL